MVRCFLGKCWPDKREVSVFAASCSLDIDIIGVQYNIAKLKSRMMPNVYNKNSIFVSFRRDKHSNLNFIGF